MAHKMLMQLTVPGQSIERYSQVIKQISILSFEHEQMLARKFRDQDDLDAACELIMSHLRFVMHIANTYKGYGLPPADLIQEGNIGLMKAVKRFNPDVGVRLVSFAVHWIRAEIHEYILRNWRIVKVATTKSQRKLFFNLRNAKKHLAWFTQNEVECVARDLGVSTKDVLEMENRLSVQDVAFDASPDDDDDIESFTPAAYLEDNRYNPATLSEQEEWKEHEEQKLHSALQQLDERSQDIIQKRWLTEQKATLQELAKIYQVSAERVRQIENNALKKLHKNLEFALA